MSSEIADPGFRRSLHRAYELGRLRGAAVRGAGAFLLGLPAWHACGRGPVAGAWLVLLGLAVAAARFRGEGFDDGARAGVVAGIVPCLLPAVLRLARPDLCDLLFARGPWLCTGAGVVAGALLGLRSRFRRDLAFWFAAVGALALAATLGCMPAGTMGFAGLAVGIAAGAVPVVAARRLSL